MRPLVGYSQSVDVLSERLLTLKMLLDLVLQAIPLLTFVLFEPLTLVFYLLVPVRKLIYLFFHLRCLVKVNLQVSSCPLHCVLMDLHLFLKIAVHL